MKRIGFIGLGAMGVHMATQLIQAGYELTVYNRSPEKTAPLKRQGAHVAHSVAECSVNQEVIITMIADDHAVTQVLTADDGVYAHASSETIVIDMSTVSPQTAKQLADQGKAHGIVKLDAPVSGSVNLAESGNLVVLVGGEKTVYERVIDVFETIGKTSLYFGEAGKGAQAKLVVNLYLGVTMQGLAESFVLADQFDLDRSQVYELLQQSALTSPFLKLKEQALVNEDFSPAFALKHMHKDLGYLLADAHNQQTVLPAASSVYQTATSAMNHDLQDQDVSALFKELLDQSGKLK